MKQIGAKMKNWFMLMVALTLVGATGCEKKVDVGKDVKASDIVGPSDKVTEDGVKPTETMDKIEESIPDEKTETIPGDGAIPMDEKSADEKGVADKSSEDLPAG
jgi:hypothetical protein